MSINSRCDFFHRYTGTQVRSKRCELWHIMRVVRVIAEAKQKQKHRRRQLMSLGVHSKDFETEKREHQVQQ